jgi:hypothetical protein
MAKMGWLVAYYPPPPPIQEFPLLRTFLHRCSFQLILNILKLPFVKMFSDIVSYSTASKILKHMLSLLVTFVVNGKKILFN